MVAHRKYFHREYQPWMADDALEYLNNGNSLASYPIHAGIPRNLWVKWLNEKNELRVVNDFYKRGLHLKKRFYR